jgi:hypothetical protein
VDPESGNPDGSMFAPKTEGEGGEEPKREFEFNSVTPQPHNHRLPVGRWYQYKTILSHATILSNETHTIFLSGSYLETQKPDGGHTNRKIIPYLS